MGDQKEWEIVLDKFDNEKLAVHNSIKEMTYTFYEIHQCNMCGSLSLNHRVLGKRGNGSQGLNPKRKKGITVSIVKCTTCGLIYPDPFPVPENIQDHYGVPPERYWTENYFKIDENYFSHELQIYKSLSHKTEIAAARSLDIGAGIGKAMMAMERSGFESYGFEPSIQFFEQAVRRMKMNPDRYILNSIETAEYPPCFFDFISFGAVLEHLYDPAMAIEKAMDWLKPNGLMHIEVPSSKWLTNKIVNTFYRLSGSDYVANLSPMHTPYHLFEFSLESFKYHGEGTKKYHVAFHDYYVCPDFTYLPKILSALTVPIMKLTNTGMQLCVWLRKSKN